MLPFANETVTIFRRTETVDANNRTKISYVKTVFKCCFWGTKKQLKFHDNVVSETAPTVVKIPFDAAEHSVFSVGDIAVHGDIPDEITADFTANDLLKKYNGSAIKIVVVKCSGGMVPLPHVSLTGGE